MGEKRASPGYLDMLLYEESGLFHTVRLWNGPLRGSLVFCFRSFSRKTYCMETNRAES